MHRMLICNSIVSFFLVLGLFFAPLASAEVMELDNAGLKRLVAEGVAVVDIRRTDEWQQTGVIKGSHLIAFYLDRSAGYTNVYNVTEGITRWTSEGSPTAPYEEQK